MNKINDEYEVLTSDGFKNFDGIKETYREDNIKLYLSDGSHIIVTPEHRIRVNKNIFRKAKNIKLGHKINKIKVTSIEHNVKCSNKFYDLINVKDGNHYITNNLTSHNCAFVPNNKFEEFKNSVIPTVSSGLHGRIIYTSTPFGMNHFYKIWKEAENNLNGFAHRFIPYWEHPLRDEKWAEDKKKELGSDVAFQQEYGCVYGSTTVNIEIDNKYETTTIEDLFLLLSLNNTARDV